MLGESSHLHFISRGSGHGTELIGTFNPLLVELSLIVAIIAAFAALMIVERVSGSRGRGDRIKWLTVGAFTLGCGIWCMHFVGMLAFKLPIQVDYDPLITFLSMVPAVIASAIALYYISQRAFDFGRAAVAGVLIGAGIGTMHYTGMAAMTMNARMAYDPSIFALSVLVACLLATFSLDAQLFLERKTKLSSLQRQMVGGTIMGFAVAGMHYTGMAAAHYFSLPTTGNPLIGFNTSAIVVAVTLV